MKDARHSEELAKTEAPQRKIKYVERAVIRSTMKDEFILFETSANSMKRI